MVVVGECLKIWGWNVSDFFKLGWEVEVLFFVFDCDDVMDFLEFELLFIDEGLVNFIVIEDEVFEFDSDFDFDDDFLDFIILLLGNCFDFRLDNCLIWNDWLSQLDIDNGFDRDDWFNLDDDLVFNLLQLDF